MAPRWARYTRSMRGRAHASAVLPPPVLLHYGDDFDEEYRGDGRLRLSTFREYVPKVPQKWDITAPGIDRPPVNPVNLLGPCFEDQVPVVTSSDYGSFVAAFDKRSNAQPDSEDDITPTVVAELVKMISETKIDFENFDDHPVLRAAWMMKFSEEKRKRMEEAELRLADMGMDDPYLAHKSLSVKIEVLLKRNDPTWAPRLIYASTDEFNALTGPVANEVCARLAKLLRVGIGSIRFMMAYKKGDVEIAEFLDDEMYPHCAEGDFSKNDLYQRRSVAYVFDALLGKVGAPEWFRVLFLRHIEFTASAPGFGLMLAELANQLPTGTTITTCRNSIWNAVMFAWHCKRKGISGKAAVLGDDLLAIIDKEINLDHWIADVALCKMVLTASAPQLAGESTFLSRRICYQGATPCMMPKLFKALARFNARGNDNQAVSDSQYMAGKSLCYAYEFRHFPDLSELFLARFRMEDDKYVVTASEVSWFTRFAELDFNKLEEVVRNEPITCSSDALVEFLFDSYGLECSPVDILQLCSRVILSKEPVLVAAPAYAQIDF